MHFRKTVSAAGGSALLAAVMISSIPMASADSAFPTGTSASSAIGSIDSSGSGNSGPWTNRLPDGFDLQAHRGGMGLHVESSPYSFGQALRIGVTTLELDTQITKDGQVVVTHDQKVNDAVCKDTVPIVDGDPAFPYSEHFIKDLDLAQIRTLDCGSERKPAYPDQEIHPGSQMMTLAEVFDLVRESGNEQVRFNIETKVEATAPEETASPEQFVHAVHKQAVDSGMKDRVAIQSFDWGVLKLMGELDSSIPLVALAKEDALEIGKPGKSPWLGGLDVDDFDGDGVAAAASIPGVKAYSPVATELPSCDATSDDCDPYTSPELVARAHELGLKVIPWTVDDVANMNYLIDAGVDGIITNYPDVLRRVLADRGIEVAGTE